ncbi:MAG: UbiA family prenyltransferase [Promethearchaeota archaeon]|jgi:4-hydroxybenzoate polyprenyltransferase
MINIKKWLFDLKPVIWVKSIFMVLIGLETTRFGLGIGRVNINIYYGSVIFALMSITGILVVMALKVRDRDEKGASNVQFKRIWIICVILFGVAFGIAIFHSIVYNLDALNLFLMAFLGIIWFLTLYYGSDWKYKGIVGSIIVGLSFSFGLIYGASLNVTLIPATIYLFFGASFTLQLSKDLINECKHFERDTREGTKTFANTIGKIEALKYSWIFDLIVILFLLIPIIPGFPNIFAQSFYMIVVLIAVIFLGIATFLTFRMSQEKTYYRSIKILLRCGMFLIFVAFILANF